MIPYPPFFVHCGGEGHGRLKDLRREIVQMIDDTWQCHLLKFWQETKKATKNLNRKLWLKGHIRMFLQLKDVVAAGIIGKRPFLRFAETRFWAKKHIIIPVRVRCLSHKRQPHPIIPCFKKHCWKHKLHIRRLPPFPLYEQNPQSSIWLPPLCHNQIHAKKVNLRQLS